MLTPQDIADVRKISGEVLRGSFTSKRVGDTPTDALQLVPKKYVDSSSTSVLGRISATKQITYTSVTGVISFARRVVVVTQSATPTINTDNTDIASITALAQAITSMTTNLSGTPAAGDALIVEITDNGTARAITWGASFESSGNIALPTTTVISTKLTVGFFWNSATSKWRCLALA